MIGDCWLISSLTNLIIYWQMLHDVFSFVEMDDKNADTNVVQVVDYVIERECELTQVKSKREKWENENFTQNMLEKIFSSFGNKSPLWTYCSPFHPGLS